MTPTNQDSPNTAGAGELKPCPFCGGEAELLDWDFPYKRFQVRCSECHAQATSGRRAVCPEAIAAWNTRAENPTQRPSVVPDEVEAMGEALFALSDRLRTSGFLISDFNHASYERVVKAWGALTAG